MLTFIKHAMSFTHSAFRQKINFISQIWKPFSLVQRTWVTRTLNCKSLFFWVFFHQVYSTNLCFSGVDTTCHLHVCYNVMTCTETYVAFTQVMEITSKLNIITVYPIEEVKVWTGTDVCSCDRRKSVRKHSWGDKTYQVIKRLKRVGAEGHFLSIRLLSWSSISVGDSCPPENISSNVKQAAK